MDSQAGTSLEYFVFENMVEASSLLAKCAEIDREFPMVRHKAVMYRRLPIHGGVVAIKAS